MITDVPNIVDSYCEQFEDLFNGCVPIKLPYEHLKWTEIEERYFTELRRNIYRDVTAQNGVNSALRCKKLICLNNAYKSGSVEELAKASSLPIAERFRAIMDVLTSRHQDFELKLWKEKRIGKPHGSFVKWYYIPNDIKKDKNHREYIEGVLTTSRENSIGLNLIVYDQKYIEDIKKILYPKTLSINTREIIPDYILRIDFAKMFYYQFPSPMFNKSLPRTWDNSLPRTIMGIIIFGIAKEVDGEKVFYEGWDPQERGEKIMNEFFVKA
jgi:hypothetical protein